MGWVKTAEDIRGERTFAKSREEQKADIIGTLQSQMRTPAVEEKLQAGKTATQIMDEYMQEHPDKAEAVTKNRSYGYSDDEMIDQLYKQDEQVERKILETKYDIRSTGDSRTDDLVLGFRKTMAGIGQTVDDISNFLHKQTGASIFMDDAEYEAHSKETKEKLRALEGAIKDKDFLSPATLGELTPAIATLPVSTQSMLAVAAMEATLGYAIERGEVDSTKADALAAGAIAGTVGGAVAGVSKLLGYIKGGSTKRAYEQFMKNNPINEQEADDLLTEYWMLNDKSGDVYADKLRAVMASNIDKEYGLDLVNTLINTSTNREKVAQTLLTEADARMRTLRKAGNNDISLETVANTIQDIDKTVSGKYDELYKAISKGGETGNNVVQKNKNIIAFNKARKDIEADELMAQQDIHSQERYILEEVSSRKDKQTARHILAVMRLSNKEQKLANKVRLKELETLAQSERKLADLNVEGMDNYLQASGTRVRDILQQEVITNADAMEAVKEINKIVRSTSGKNMAKKYELGKVKEIFQDKLKQNLSEGEWDEWSKVQESYKLLSDLRSSKLGQAINNLAKEGKATSEDAILEFAKDLPKLLDDSNYDVFGTISALASKRQASLVERKMIGTILDMSNPNFVAYDWSKFNNIFVRSKFRTPEGRAFKSMIDTTRKVFGDDVRYGTPARPRVDDARTGQSHASNFIMNAVIIRQLASLFKHTSAEGRLEHRVSKILKSPAEVKKFNRYMQELGDGQKDKIMAEVARLREQGLYQPNKMNVVPKTAGVTASSAVMGEHQ